MCNLAAGRKAWWAISGGHEHASDSAASEFGVDCMTPDNT